MVARKREAGLRCVNVRVTEEEARLLTIWAEKHGITVADILRRSVQAIITAEPPEFYVQEGASA